MAEGEPEKKVSDEDIDVDASDPKENRTGTKTARKTELGEEARRQKRKESRAPIKKRAEMAQREAESPPPSRYGSLGTNPLPESDAQEHEFSEADKGR